MAEGRHLFALDFDGVVCDSVEELYLTAFEAAKEIWPDIFGDGTKWSLMPDWLLRCCYEVRPVLETGFEGVLMVRLLVDAYLGAEADPGPPLAAAVDQMLTTWDPETIGQAMRRFGVAKPQLTEAFGAVRDRWIATDEPGWLRSLRFYPGVTEALQAAMAAGPVYIITTKQQHFTQRILQSAGIHLPDRNVYGLGMYRNKLEVLQDLAGLPEHQGYTIHFVEDRYHTLEAIRPHLERLPVELYLAVWGYNTPAVRQAAEKAGHVCLLDLEGFCRLLGARE